MAEDCTAYERAALLGAIEHWEAGRQPARQQLTFNRFEFTLDAEQGTVLLEDVLDATDLGSEVFSLEELRSALGAAPSA